MQFLPDDPAQDFFKGLLLTLDMFFQRVIEHRLIAAPTFFIHCMYESTIYNRHLGEILIHNIRAVSALVFFQCAG